MTPLREDLERVVCDALVKYDMDFYRSMLPPGTEHRIPPSEIVGYRQRATAVVDAIEAAASGEREKP